MEDLTDEEFETLKSNMIKDKKTKDNSISEESSRNWIQITNTEHIFNIQEISIKALESITKTELQEIFKSFTQPENARILNVHVIGDAEANVEEFKIDVIKEKLKEDEDIVTDIEEFKQSMNLHPIVMFEI